tara:strand:+ start:1314 stop:1418 length:105 start_codon:yes stop_codon:yes gene_type:complete
MKHGSDYFGWMKGTLVSGLREADEIHVNCNVPFD